MIKYIILILITTLVFSFDLQTALPYPELIILIAY